MNNPRQTAASASPAGDTPSPESACSGFHFNPAAFLWRPPVHEARRVGSLLGTDPPPNTILYRVLNLVRSSKRPVTGEYVAKKLGIGRNARANLCRLYERQLIDRTAVGNARGQYLYRAKANER